MENLIVLENITKVFSTDEVDTYALNEVSLQIGKQEYVAITGPSGGGKSTLLSILGLLDNSTSGKYTLNGQDATALSEAESVRIRNREIGFIFQSFNLISDLTVEENVALPLSYRKEIPKTTRLEKARTALEKVDMGHRAKHYPAQLSGGQQQRIAVARAIVGEPSIILADEPTGNLDSANAEVVMNIIDKLHQSGSTICLITHDPESAKRAQRVVKILDGKIQTEETEKTKNKEAVA